jgi:hypothetical protein
MQRSRLMTKVYVYIWELKVGFQDRRTGVTQPIVHWGKGSLASAPFSKASEANILCAWSILTMNVHFAS